MSLEKTRVGMIGYGGVGRVHVLAYRSIPQHYGLPAETIRVVSVATAHQETARTAAAEIGCEAWTDQYAEMLARHEVDLVTVAVPNDAHEQIVTAAAEAGVHIFCEKPLAVDVDEAKRMQEAVAQAGVKAQVNFNFRYYPGIQHARRLVEQGLLGRVFSFRACFYRSSYIDYDKPISWRLQRDAAGGGALFDLGSHVLDAIYYLLGDFDSVLATAETMIKERPLAPGAAEMGRVDVDDITLMQARMADGALGSVQISRLATGVPNEMTLEIYGDRGAIRFTSADPSWLHVYDTRSPREGYQALQVGGKFADQLAPHWSMPPGFAPTFAAGQYALLQAISADARPAPDMADGLHVQAVMGAAIRSSGERRWVDLSEVL